MSAYEMAHWFARRLNERFTKSETKILMHKTHLKPEESSPISLEHNPRKIRWYHMVIWLRCSSKLERKIVDSGQAPVLSLYLTLSLGEWLSQRQVVGRTMKAAVEDVCLAVNEEPFASLVREVNGLLDISIDEVFDENQIYDVKEKSEIRSDSEEQGEHASNFADVCNNVLPAVGDLIEVSGLLKPSTKMVLSLKFLTTTYLQLITTTVISKTYTTCEKKIGDFQIQLCSILCLQHL